MGIHAFVIFLTLQFFIQGEEKKSYIIYHGNNEIGTISAAQKKVNDSTYYDVRSLVNYHSLLYNMDRLTVTKVNYKGQQLTSSSALIEKNGKIEGKSNTTYKQGTYYIESSENENKTLKSPIYWCTSRMYFEEPLGVKSIFAEAYQELCPIQATETPHVYELTLPGNKKNEYVYAGGQLKEVKVHRTLFSVTFKLKP